MAHAMMANGKLEEWTVMAHTLTQTETSTLDNGGKTASMEKELSDMSVGHSMKEIGLQIENMDLGRTPGQTDHHMRVIIQKAVNMDKAF